jgi:hypothetical protein
MREVYGERHARSAKQRKPETDRSREGGGCPNREDFLQRQVEFPSECTTIRPELFLRFPRRIGEAQLAVKAK